MTNPFISASVSTSSPQVRNVRLPTAPPSSPGTVKCNCGLPATRLQVKKEGPNHGKFFFVCSKPKESQCKFYQFDTNASSSIAVRSATSVASYIQQSASNPFGGAVIATSVPAPAAPTDENVKMVRMNNPFVSAPVSASVPASSSQAVTIIGTAAPQTADDDDDTEDNTSNVPSSDSAPTVMCKCNPPAQAAKNTVKKEGPNKGKEFYSCAKYMTDTSRCKFFEWADKIAQQQQSASSASSSSSSGSSSYNSLYDPYPPVSREVQYHRELLGRNPDLNNTFVSDADTVRRRSVQQVSCNRYKEVAQQHGYTVTDGSVYEVVYQYIHLRLFKGDYNNQEHNVMILSQKSYNAPTEGQFPIEWHGAAQDKIGWLRNNISTDSEAANPRSNIVALETADGFYNMHRKNLWRYVDQVLIKEKGLEPTATKYFEKIFWISIEDLKEYDAKVGDASLKVLLEFWPCPQPQHS